MDYPKEKLFQCDICGKAFNCETILEKDTIEHNTQKRLYCNQCDKHFSRKETLKSHIMTHDSDKNASM